MLTSFCARGAASVGTALLLLAIDGARIVVSQAPAAAVPAGAPNTDVFLAPIIRRGSEVTLGALRNVTNRPGYDNQPSFDPRGRWLAVVGTATAPPATTRP
jgi:hypothetical protein